MKDKCEIGKTEFVDEYDVGKGVVSKISESKLKIKNNQFKCMGDYLKKVK